MRFVGLADTIRASGVQVVETAGWRTRGNDTLQPNGIVHHHDAASVNSERSMPDFLIKGRTDLVGPLYNVWFNRAGVAYVLAAGKANHAGSGSWMGASGNSAFLGFCLANRGTGEPYPIAQTEAWARATVWVNRALGLSSTSSCGHKEYAPTRKIDPFNQNMARFRTTVDVGFSHGEFTPTEIEHMRGLLASMYRVGSNPSYPQHLITDYRRRNA